MVIGSKQIIVLYYLAFSLVILSYSCINPAVNWDILAYVASAKSFETDDMKEIHSFTYEQAKKSLPSSKYEDLLGVNYDYRGTMQKDPVAFYLQLPTYKIRLFYVLIVFLLYKAGLNIVFATYFVSALSVAIAFWFIFLIGRELQLMDLWMYVLPPLLLGYGILSIADLSTPDGLTFFSFVFCSYLFIKKRIELLLVVPLLAAVRSDAILFSVPFLLYLMFSDKKRRMLSFLALVATVIVYWFINGYCKYPGWKTIFYYNFLSQPMPYFMHIDKITFKEYGAAFNDGIRGIIYNKLFVVYMLINVLFAILSSVKFRYNKIMASGFPEINVLCVLSALYVIVHFVLFPLVWDRFFMAQYVIATIGLLAVLSNRMSMVQK